MYFVSSATYQLHEVVPSLNEFSPRAFLPSGSCGAFPLASSFQDVFLRVCFGQLVEKDKNSCILTTSDPVKITEGYNRPVKVT